MRRESQYKDIAAGLLKSRKGEDLNKREFGWHLANVARSPLALQFERLIVGHVRLLLDAPEDDVETVDLDVLPSSARELFHRDRTRRRAAARRILARYADYLAGEDPLETNLSYARAEFGFDEIDVRILRLVRSCRRNRELDSFVDQIFRRLRNPARTVATLIDAAANDVADHLAPKGRLVACGFLVSENTDAPDCLFGGCGAFQMASSLAKLMSTPFRSREEWLAALFGEPAAATLEWADFAHLGAIAELAAGVLSGAADAGAAGVNILARGPVGTGKTEFCKALAARVGLPIWPVGEADDDGAEPERHERVAALRLAQRLLAKRGRSLILFDEAEDMIEADSFSGPGFRLRGRRGSKAYLNRALEQNPVPVLWTCNELDGIDPAILRRMTLVLEVKTPTAPVRARIWRKVAADTGLSLDEAAVERFARLYDAPPSVAANAARAASLAGGGAEETETAITGTLRVLGLAPRASGAEAGDFDPALTNCSHDLDRLVDDLARPGAPRAWSLCLQGPPGTGKSHFARHVATRLGMEVTQKRASDLLSMWVGESEKQIARAFAEARDAGALLVFDEADSLLSERGRARHSWEITQVNEMLTWMEAHPLPFVCTTNLMERLDQASLRRFTLKLRFETLAPAQAALAFTRCFGLAAAGPLPEGLAPGDFATVRRKRDLLGDVDAAALRRWLEEEVEAKGPRSKPIGFGRPLG